MIQSAKMATFLNVYLTLFIYFSYTVIQSNSADIITLCSSGDGYDKLITDYEKLTMTINTSTWPDHVLTCTMVFRAKDRSDDLYYKFNSFHLNDFGTSLTFESASYTLYSLEASYSRHNAPNVGSIERTNTYLKITIRRASSSDVSLKASFTVFTEDYNKVYWNPRLGLTLGSIIGIVGGIISLIIFIIIVVCCLCAKSRRNRGVVMAPTTQVATTTTTMASPYPYGHPPEQYAMHPMYQGNQISAYPPGVYPGSHVVPYSGPPPAYNDLALVRSAQPKLETINHH